MKYVTPFILVIFLISSVTAQQATIWGPGKNYEIAYIHSGNYNLNGTSLINFQNEPSAEFKINTITNDGYQYTYFGYNETNEEGQVTIQSFSFGIFSIDLPTGGMPFVLPLAYGNEDDWLVSFSSKLNELSLLNPENQLFNGSSSIEDDQMIIEFTAKSNVTNSFENNFFSLPQFQFSEYEGTNSTYVNSTMHVKLSYLMTTGVLFELSMEISADEFLLDDISMGTVENSQELEFVAIIPPASIIDEALPLTNASIFLGISISYFVFRRNR